MIAGPSIRVGGCKPLPEFGSQGNLEKGKAIWNFAPCPVAAGLAASYPVMLPTDQMEAASGEDVLYLLAIGIKYSRGQLEMSERSNQVYIRPGTLGDCPISLSLD